MQNRYFEIQKFKKKNYKNNHLEDCEFYLKTILLQGYKVYEFDNNQGDLIPYHAHREAEQIIVFSGGIRLIIEEHLVDLYEYQMITIAPWAIHLLSFPFAGGALFYRCVPPLCR